MQNIQQNQGADKAAFHSTLRLLSMREVQSTIGGKSRSTIYRWISQGQFPKPIKIGVNSGAWPEESIVAWRESLIAREVA